MRRLAIYLATVLAVIVSCSPALAQSQDTITTLIGGGPNNMPATDANLNGPVAIAVDAAGNYYIAANNQNRVFKVDTTGTLTVLAGTGAPGYAGDGVPGGAANALLNNPSGVAVDSAGNVYIADLSNFVIRQVDSTNTITTIAGVAGACAYNGEGSPATGFDLCNPAGLAVDGSGNLYIADSENCRVRKLVLASSTISTLSGTGTCAFGGDHGAAGSAKLDIPTGVAVDAAGDVFIADSQNYRIREVTAATGIINTVAGNGTQGFLGDGGLATKAEIGTVQQGVVVDSTGTVVTIADESNNRVRQFTVAGKIASVAGDGNPSYCGDGGPALKACLNSPQALGLNGGGGIYVADTGNNVVRLFTVGGTISTTAGNGSATAATPIDQIGPLNAVLNNPSAAIEDPSGNFFVADTSDFMVRELMQSSGLLDFFAGNGMQGYAGDGGPATQAEMGSTLALARDTAGNIYMADADNCVIRQVNAAGVISDFAGTPGTCGYAGDGALATNAQLSTPSGVFVDSQNNVYIADTGNNVVRKVSAGVITTFAGDGGAGFLGDGGPAIAAELNAPTDVTGDGAGNLYIADSLNQRIRAVNPAGVVSTVAGNGTAGFSGDGVATEQELNSPSGLTADAQGDLFIADTGNNLVRWVDAAGIMTTFGGNGAFGFSGDGGPALNAELAFPAGIAQDSAGNFLVADQGNGRIRSISAFAGLNVSARSLAFGVLSVGSTSAPQTLTLSALGPLVISNISTSGDFLESDDCGASLPNGQTCTVYVYFRPTASGSRAGALTIQHNGYFGSSTTVSLVGTGSAILISGAPVNFGNQAVKTTGSPKTITILNKGTSAILMGAITLDETADFAIASNNCPAAGHSLSGKKKCTITLTFTPQSTGAKKGALSVNDSDPTSPQIVGLSGVGASNVVLTPERINFAEQAVGTTSAATQVTLTNNTGAVLTLGAPALSFAGPFHSGSTTTCTDGLVLVAAGTCTIAVTFRPSSTGFFTGSLNVSDSDASSPQSVALSGTGAGIQFSPASVNFGRAKMGQKVSAKVIVSNVGATTVTFSGATFSGTNAADFSTDAGEPPCGGSLAAGATCTIQVFFIPSLVGKETATYQVYDNSPGSPQSVALHGIGH